MKLLYTKYSNDRAPEYQIRTDIIKKDNGEKTVVKRPVCDKAKGHIKKLYDTHEELGRLLKETRFELNEIAPFEDGYEFKFLSGITLEERLDELVSNKQYDEFKSLYQEFLDDINSFATEKFQVSQGFIDTFGDWNLRGEYYCSPITDIDILFANIFIQDNRWIIIDYEWTYDFLIPIKFVIFRTVYYYLSFGREGNISKHIDMYEMAGITDEEKQEFLKIEQCFQRSLMRNYYSLWNVNDSMKSRTYYPFFMVDEKNSVDNSKNGHIVLYKGESIVDKIEYRPGIAGGERLI